ncbi:MAG TPA: hypothetical protein VNQ77_14050 [Frankiaceae bacterium]|nr:hypothetical protein [Frankiaceae bacterium]
MASSELDTALQCFAAAGAERGLFYLSVPITTGRREFALMRELGVEREALRVSHRERWLDDVVRPNERDALLWTEAFSEGVGLGHLVVNPGRLQRDHWSQRHYDELWTALLETFPAKVVATPEWAYSRGARVEIALALRRDLPVLTLDGTYLTAADLAAQRDAADARLAEWGFDPGAVLPGLDVEVTEPAAHGERPPEYDAMQVFSWLIRERNYQLRKFGVAQDDEHTRADGVRQDGWWWRQLLNYFHRAGVLGLDTPNGRQALAKFTATACGLTESVIRVHGPLPEPGHPSGHVEGSGHGGHAGQS